MLHQVSRNSETVQIRLPKGPRAFSPERINGRLAPGSYYTRKVYQVTVDPSPHDKLMTGPILSPRPPHRRQHGRCDALPPIVPTAELLPISDGEDGEGNDSGSLSRPAAIFDAVNKRKIYYAKASFRQQRAPAFEKVKLFPVLANQQLMPEWRDSTSPMSEDDDLLSPKQKARKRLVSPTVAGALRQKTHSPQSSSQQVAWLPPLGAPVIRKEFGREPILYNERYKTFRIKFRPEVPDVKREYRFAGTDRLEAKMAIARSNGGGKELLELEKEIQEIRKQGVRNKEKLQNRYDAKLEAYKDEQEKRGWMSNFNRRELQMQSKKEVVIELVEEQVVPEERLGLDFARYRKSVFSLEAGGE
jgi:hypothetical protein